MDDDNDNDYVIHAKPTSSASDNKLDESELVVKRKRVIGPKKLTHDDMADANKGLPFLFKSMQNFKSNPGKEAKDVDRLLGLYTDWVHKLAPGMKLADFIHLINESTTSGVKKKAIMDILGSMRQDQYEKKYGKKSKSKKISKSDDEDDDDNYNYDDASNHDETPAPRVTHDPEAIRIMLEQKKKEALERKKQMLNRKAIQESEIISDVPTQVVNQNMPVDEGSISEEETFSDEDLRISSDLSSNPNIPRQKSKCRVVCDTDEEEEEEEEGEFHDDYSQSVAATQVVA